MDGIFSMMPHLDRWELGSEFNWLPYPPTNSETAPWRKACRLYGTGRDALRALLLWGSDSHGWRRVLVPSYFCQDVIESLLSFGIEVSIYPDGPG